jgi:hypothetical protein
LAQVVEYLPSKLKVLSSNPNTTKGKKKIYIATYLTIEKNLLKKPINAHQLGPVQIHHGKIIPGSQALGG